jgi:hypothetical protein
MNNLHREPHFAGVVVEVFDNSILVIANEGEEVRNSSDLFYVSLETELTGGWNDFMSGDEVTVFFDGTILESYPAQINKVYAIVLTSQSKLDDWIDIDGIEVIHILSGQSTEWTIVDKKQIEDLHAWFINLSLTKQHFEEGQSPGDSDGGEIYMLTLLQSNNDKISFTYGKYGSDECYIIYYGEWYKVNNPSDPFND